MLQTFSLPVLQALGAIMAPMQTTPKSASNTPEGLTNPLIVVRNRLNMIMPLKGTTVASGVTRQYKFFAIQITIYRCQSPNGSWWLAAAIASVKGGR
jgi:hypothetical protein